VKTLIKQIFLFSLISKKEKTFVKVLNFDKGCCVFYQPKERRTSQAASQRKPPFFPQIS